jgi:cytochrome c oxidase cbb3-type subunit 2
MPNYPWLAKTRLVPEDVVPKMRALKRLSVPYTEQEIKDAPAALAEKTEQDALIAYLQGLGILIKTRN